MAKPDIWKVAVPEFTNQRFPADTSCLPGIHYRGDVKTFKALWMTSFILNILLLWATQDDLDRFPKSYARPETPTRSSGVGDFGPQAAGLGVLTIQWSFPVVRHMETRQAW